MLKSFISAFDKSTANWIFKVFARQCWMNPSWGCRVRYMESKGFDLLGDNQLGSVGPGGWSCLAGSATPQSWPSSSQGQDPTAAPETASPRTPGCLSCWKILHLICPGPAKLQLMWKKWKYPSGTNSSQVIVLTVYWVLTERNTESFCRHKHKHFSHREFLGMFVTESGAVPPSQCSTGNEAGAQGPKSAISPWQLSTWCAEITELSHSAVFSLFPPTPNCWDCKSWWTAVLPKPKIKFKNSAVELKSDSASFL